MGRRKYSKDGSPHWTDEVFNTISHMVGAILSLTGAVLLVVQSSQSGKVWHIISFSIYGLSLFFLFLSSTLHHGVKAKKKVEQRLKIMDYAAIFPLIAGTYTPFCLILLRNGLGWSILGIIWGLAIIGIVFKAVFPDIPKWFTQTLYVTMGLISVIMVFPLLKLFSPAGLFFLALGGVFYIIGSVIFYKEIPNPLPGRFGFHEIWHIFVLLGALSHFIVMYFYILPLPA